MPEQLANNSHEETATALLEKLEAGTQESNNQATRYVVRLPVFEGPLDLLLHLIEKRQMEITTISLLAVTDQYLAYLEHWDMQAEALPLANMAAFVSIAARLLYIKSQSLLPQTSKDDMKGEMEKAAEMAENLRTHLLEYKLTKEIASYLKVREAEGLQTYGRVQPLAGVERQLAWSPPTLVGLEAQSLAQAFQRLLELRAKDEARGVDLMPLSRVRVSDRIAEIVALLSDTPRISFANVIENERSALVIIVTFIAALEMWKHRRLVVTQDELFGPIMLERGELWSEALDGTQLDED